MASATWTGVTSSYTDTGNWNPSVPGTGDTATFDSSAFNRTVDVNLTKSVGGWTFNGGDYTSCIVGVTLSFSGAGVQVNDGSATIEALNGGTIAFFGNSDGGTARYIIDGSPSGIELDNPDVAVNVGSIEGGGNIALSSGDLLSVGGNNLSTYFNGDFTALGGGSDPRRLVKVGTGSLTLAGNLTLDTIAVVAGTLNLNTASNFASSMTLDGGFLGLNVAGAGGSAAITVTGGWLDVLVAGSQGTAAITLSPLPGQLAIVGIHAANLVSTSEHFANSLTVGSTSNEFILIPFMRPNATAQYDATNNKLVVTDSVTTVTFDNFHAPNGTRFAALTMDGIGGTTVVPAIFGTVPHAVVNGTNGLNVIVANGLDETIRAFAGADFLVGGAPGVLMYGGLGADQFLFNKVSAGPASNPDVIMDFNHAQHDLIDLHNLDFFATGHSLVFIGGDTFAHYHSLHPSIFGMVRYAGGLVQVNLNHTLGADFEVKVHGSPALHAGDFML